MSKARDLLKVIPDISEGIEVDTSKWKNSTGKSSPSGVGAWAFYFDSTEGSPWFAPGSTKYSDAVALARKEAEKRGAKRIILAP